MLYVEQPWSRGAHHFYSIGLRLRENNDPRGFLAPGLKIRRYFQHVKDLE